MTFAVTHGMTDCCLLAFSLLQRNDARKDRQTDSGGESSPGPTDAMALRDALLALSLVSSSAAAAASRGSWPVYFLNNSIGVEKNAVCLDGSPGAFYIRRNPLSSKWRIFLEHFIEHSDHSEGRRRDHGPQLEGKE